MYPRRMRVTYIMKHSITHPSSNIITGQRPFIQGGQRRRVLENASTSVSVGTPLNASDDARDVPPHDLLFSIIEPAPDKAAFRVAEDGQLFVLAPLDYEVLATHRLLVRVTDKGPGSPDDIAEVRLCVAIFAVCFRCGVQSVATRHHDFE